jgi:TonB-dependent SusC/RagA subfamily outer membrane receptor
MFILACLVFTPATLVGQKKAKKIVLTGIVSDQDGNPVYSVEGINPNEVESISILNGASASIYGYRGSNGVILFRMK